MNKIDDYLRVLGEPERNVLERIRQIVHRVVPNAEDVMSYGIPGFKYNGKYLLGFAAFKDHLSLFPTSGPIADLKDMLKAYKLAKGTIQFILDNQIPDDLINKLIQVRLHDID